MTDVIDEDLPGQCRTRSFETTDVIDEDIPGQCRTRLSTAPGSISGRGHERGHEFLGLDCWKKSLKSRRWRTTMRTSGHGLQWTLSSTAAPLEVYVRHPSADICRHWSPMRPSEASFFALRAVSSFKTGASGL